MGMGWGWGEKAVPVQLSMFAVRFVSDAAANSSDGWIWPT